jgi:hypothetical protein|tara:strand:- start:2291 stop:3157 length:867 start_codon:yes stop_codon:yes gene_type:complete
MISIVGLGNAATAIVEKFKEVPQYSVYVMNDKVARNSKYKFKLKAYDHPELYEKHIPDVKKFLDNTEDHIQFFVVGGSYSSNYSLGILEQIKDKKVDVVYIKPDTELLTGYPVLIENAVFGVLQEYARSGMFNSMTIVSNLNLENCLGDLPIKTYYDSLNQFIFSTMHHVNYFTHTEPEIGQVSKPAEINRIRSVAGLDLTNLEEKWLFELDTPRELCYYLAIKTERLENEGGLHKRLVDMLKEKPRNAFRKLSYAIYETPYNDFGFCVAHTNVVQNNQKTLDKLVQE